MTHRRTPPTRPRPPNVEKLQLNYAGPGARVFRQTDLVITRMLSTCAVFFYTVFGLFTARELIADKIERSGSALRGVEVSELLLLPSVNWPLLPFVVWATASHVVASLTAKRVRIARWARTGLWAGAVVAGFYSFVSSHVMGGTGMLATVALVAGLIAGGVMLGCSVGVELGVSQFGPAGRIAIVLLLGAGVVMLFMTRSQIATGLLTVSVFLAAPITLVCYVFAILILPGEPIGTQCGPTFDRWLVLLVVALPMAMIVVLGSAHYYKFAPPLWLIR